MKDNFDFAKEFRKLYKESPCCGAYTRASENCPYGDIVVVSKDCYMCFNCGQCRNAYYCENSKALTDCYDCAYSEGCEICYQCVDLDSCYNCDYSQDCSNCDSVQYSYDLRRCKDCFGCVTIRDKQYYIFNEKYSRKEYEKKLEELKKMSHGEIDAKVEKLKFTMPRMYSHQQDTENCTGDYIYHSKNCHMCFDARHSEDSAFIVMANLDTGTKDSYDCGPMPTGMDLCYGISYAHYLFNCRHLYFCGNLKDSRYCNNCFESEHLFGCSYLTKKQKKFFILNEEVDEQTYRKKTAEIEKDLIERGIYTFYDLVYKDLSKLTKKIPDEQLSRKCQICGGDFEIIPMEVKYYKKHNIPFPIYCFNCRAEQRIKLRNEWKLYKRICDFCKKDIISTYTPDSKYKVYCFKCYWGEMG